MFNPSPDHNTSLVTSYRLEIFTALRDGADPSQLPDGAATAILNWWEGVASLTRSRALGRKGIHAIYRLICQRWWLILAEHARRIRLEAADDAIFEDFEWLARLMAEMDRQTGKALFDKSTAGSIEEEIEYLQGRIRIEEALRTVIIKPPDVATTPAVGSGAGAAVTGPLNST